MCSWNASTVRTGPPGPCAWTARSCIARRAAARTPGDGSGPASAAGPSGSPSPPSTFSPAVRERTRFVIVVAGEALIDLVPQGRGALAGLTPALGGGPYNTAVALGRLGSPTAFCSRTSRDAFGEALLDGLRDAGVDVSAVQRGPEPTTLAVATIDTAGSAAYSFYVDGTADRLFAAPAELPAGTRAVSFGTCSLVLEPGASAYEELLRAAAAQGVFTALDPNIRAGLIPDADAYRARFKSWLPSVSLLKLSQEDALWLGGTPSE
ncbi:fructokinase, partial [Streptomyces sviceus ATCC 29083]